MTCIKSTSWALAYHPVYPNLLSTSKCSDQRVPSPAPFRLYIMTHMSTDTQEQEYNNNTTTER
eukprot:scaffold119487_cov54-Phaeocystis_antarctica.AAC.1